MIQLVSQVDTNLTFHQNTFGTNENQAPVQPKEITNYNANLDSLKTTFTTNIIAQGSTFTFDYQTAIKFLTDKRTAVNNSLTQNQKHLQTLQHWKQL